MDKLVEIYFADFCKASRRLFEFYQSFNKPGAVVGVKRVDQEFVFFFRKRKRLLKEDLAIVRDIDAMGPTEFMLFILVDDPADDKMTYYEYGAVERDFGDGGNIFPIEFAGKNSSPCSNPLCRDLNARCFCDWCDALYCGLPCKRRDWEDHKHLCGNDLDFNFPDE